MNLHKREAIFELGWDKMIYIRAVEHESGHHEMFALCQRKEDGKFDARVRCRRPVTGKETGIFEKTHGEHYMKGSHELPKGTTREAAIQWVISTSTKQIPILGAMNPVVSDLAYEFEEYDIDDVEAAVEQIKKSGLFDIMEVPNDAHP